MLLRINNNTKIDGKKEDEAIFSGSEEEGEHLMKYRFDSQTKLKKAKNIMSEDYLKIEDQSLDAYLKSLMNSINEKANECQNSRFNQLFKTETSLIASLYNFPYKIEQVYDILSKVPKAVMANKHIYEQIFSLLQIHTCYIKEMFTVNDELNKDELLFSIINSIFRQKYDSSNSQKNIYAILNIIRHIVLSKRNNELHEIIFSKKKNSLFHKLFYMIMSDQIGNIAFIKDEFINYFKQLKNVTDLEECEEHKDEISQEKANFEIQQELNDENVDVDNTVDLEILKDSILKLLDRLDNRYKDLLKNAKDSSYLSEDIRWLISFVRKQLILEVFHRRIGENISDIETLSSEDLKQIEKSDDVTKVLLELIFEPVFKDLLKLSIKQDFVKILGEDKCNSLSDKYIYKGYLLKFIKLLQSSLIRDSYMVKQIHEDESYQDNCRKQRNSILNKFGMDLLDYDLDLNILKFTLMNSMNFKPTILNISVEDVITIHNIEERKKNRRLYDFDPNAANDIFLDENFNDPLFKLLENIKGDEINEKLTFDSQMRINLYLKTKLLIDESCLIKCESCFMPVSRTMISQKNVENNQNHDINSYEEDEDEEEEENNNLKSKANNNELLKQK